MKNITELHVKSIESFIHVIFNDFETNFDILNFQN